MIAPDLESAIDGLQELVEGARVIAPFTGAGISTECGIPDFRSPGGLWTKNRPIPFDEFLASQDMRNEAWRRRFAMDEQFSSARPGRGHLALSTLYRVGKAPAVITQNIDNLHQSSGIPAEHVIELHGNNSYAACLDCGKRYELTWVRQRFTEARERAPDCSDCGGHIKTATAPGSSGAVPFSPFPAEMVRSFGPHLVQELLQIAAGDIGSIGFRNRSIVEHSQRGARGQHRPARAPQQA